MNIDKRYCASSYLMYRRIVDERKCFSMEFLPHRPTLNSNRICINDSIQLENALKMQICKSTADGKAALALSGGIDSAILAKMMPPGSVAYTFRCVVPGVSVTDETKTASKYAEACGLEHRIVEIYWEDMEKYAPILMKHKGAPIHSIEVQIYLAAQRAKADGFERLIFGESADCVFGGLSSILSKEWTIGDFIERYAYVMPYKVLRESELVLEPIIRHEKDGYVDPHEFMSTEFYPESIGSYMNAVETAGFDLVIPYANCIMGGTIDYDRIRKGENKYLVREVFQKLYESFEIPKKTPMPRPTNEWFKDWNGPSRKEFYSHCIDDMTGDQKWLVWCLEKFYDMLDNGNSNYV